MSKAFTPEPSTEVLRVPFNPYIAGNPVKGLDGFFGRDDIFREVLQMLRHPQSNAIVLYGQRRIGKTSVLLELERRLANEGEFTPISFDLQNKAAKPLAELLYELAQGIAAKTGQAAPEHANFDSDDDYFRRTFLPIAARAAGRGGLALLFDEFDVFDGPEPSQSSKAFFPYLRNWMAGVEGVHFVFVIGRRPEDLSIETMSAFKGVRAASVSLLEREAAEAVIRQSERDGSLVWSDAACEIVWDWAQGHPYFTQLLCSVVWENAHDALWKPTPRVVAADVDDAIDEALQQGANAFVWIWDGLPPAERLVMAAIAEAGDAIITREMLEEILNRSGVRIIMRELTLAPETLVEWGLLRSVDSGYRFVVPLLRRWVATNRPLRRVKDEIDRLDPQAERLFQTGQSYYNHGEPLEADYQLRKALQSNPNHLKSRLLLGQILLESNHAVESVAILEEAYQYDVGAARIHLIKSLLAMADGHAEMEQLATYERVLNIDPNQPVAREWWRTIWVARGEAAVTQNQWVTALEAFQKAGDLTRVEEVRQLKRIAEPRPLSMWNPFDYIRLLWWVLVIPKVLKAYQAELDDAGKKLLKRQANWLASTLAWWPLLAAAIWLCFDTRRAVPTEVCPRVMIIIGCAWLLTGRFEKLHRNALVIALLITFEAAAILVTGALGLAGSSAISVFILTVAVACGVAQAVVANTGLAQLQGIDYINTVGTVVEYAVPAGLASGVALVVAGGGQ